MAVNDVREDERSLLRAAFERDGYVLIEGALSPDEIGRLTAAVDRVRGAERPDEDGPLHLRVAHER